MRNFWLALSMITPLMAKGQTYNHGTYETHCRALNYLEADNADIAYLDIGQGPVLLLMHGVPTSSWIYRNMIPPLVEAGFRVIVPDMMGFGQSGRPEADDQLDFSAQGQYLEALIDHLGIEALSICVHDAGGPWTWQWLHRTKTRVHSAILLNTILYLEGFHPPIKWRRGSLGNRLLSWAYQTPVLGKMIVGFTLKKGVGRHRYSKVEKEGYTAPMTTGAGRAMGLFMGSFDDLPKISDSGRKALKERNIPICTIWGEHDPFLRGQTQLPLAMQELNLKQEDVHILQGCRHFVQDELPEDIVSLMVEFLNRSGEQ